MSQVLGLDHQPRHDRRFGSRSYAGQRVVQGLDRSKRPEAGEVLTGLQPDPVVSGHAVKASEGEDSGRPRGPQAMTHIEYPG